MHRFQRAVVSPSPVLLPDGGPGRKIMRQRSPRAAVLGLVEDGVPDLAQQVAPWLARPAILGPRHCSPHNLPLPICQIRRVRLSTHAPKLPDDNDFVHSYLFTTWIAAG